MRPMLIAFTAAGLVIAAASSALAEGRATDVDYLRASRCKGLATGLAADTAGFDAYLKIQGRQRDLYMVQRGVEEQQRGRKDARNSERAAKVSAELEGPCQAYKG